MTISGKLHTNYDMYNKCLSELNNICSFAGFFFCCWEKYYICSLKEIMKVFDIYIYIYMQFKIF